MRIGVLSYLYACADCYAITPEYEGYALLTLAEVMTSGLRCIVSNILDLQIARDVGCGVTVNFDDINGDSDQISEYIMKTVPFIY